MDSKIISVAEIGNVLLKKSKRARHLIISLNTPENIRVAIPLRMSFKTAEQFVHSKKRWLEKQIKSLNSIRQKHAEYFAGKQMPHKKLARKILLRRVNELASENNLSFNKIFIREQKTRWGSCSSMNNINLNRKLLLLPDELIDYVILHELVHTRVKNHSKRFYAELTKILPEAGQLDARLSKFRIEFI